MTGALGPGEFIAGGIQLALTLGMSGASAVVVVRRRFGSLDGVPRAVALGLLTIAALLMTELLPLLLGVLTRFTVLVAGALILLASRRLRAVDVAPSTAPPAGAAIVSRALAGVGLLIAATAALAYLEIAATQHVTSVDALGFHFPGAIRFIQTGSLWNVTQYLPGQAQGYYPQYGDLLFLAVALPLHSLAFVRYVDPVLLVLAGIAIYAIGRELDAPGPVSALAAAATLTIRPTLGPALPDVLTDPLFLAAFAAGALFLLRSWRTGARRELVLAGVGFGIALGTKWYGLTDVPLLVLAWLVAAAVSRRAGAWRDAGTVIGVTALAGGIWMLRNLLLTGNPVFDLRVRLFGVTLFPAPFSPLRHDFGYTLAHYLGDWSVWRVYIWPVLRSDFGLVAAVVLGGALVAGVIALVARRAGAASFEPRVPILLAAAALCVVAYLVTPYTAQGYAGMPVLVNANTRYGAPALVLAAPLLAWAAGRLPRMLRLIVEVVLVLEIRADVHRYIPTGAGRLIVSGAVLVALLCLLWAGRRGAWRTVAVVAACGAAAFAYHYQRTVGVTPWTPDDATIDYVDAHAPSGARIAVTGTWTAQGVVPVAPLFGPRFGNKLSYVGPFVSHRLEAYTAEGPFVAALRRGRFSLLEIGTGFPPAADPVQYGWARAAGYVFVARSARLILMRPAPR